MRGAIPPIPQYAYKAWSSVKTQRQFYLYLTGVGNEYILNHVSSKQ